MAEGVPENSVTYFIAGGHDHDGINSTKIDMSRYDLYDFVDKLELEREVRRIVNAGSINPSGGVIIGDGSNGQPPLIIGPKVPGPATGLTVTAGVHADATSYLNVSWNPSNDAENYIVELHRSTDSGANYIKVTEVIVDGLTYVFDNLPNMATVSTTRYKVVISARSQSGIIGILQELSNISPAVDSTPPSGPQFETASTNHFVSFRGFLARLQDNTEADMKWGIGQFEYSLSTSVASESNWVTNEVETGRQTGRIISVTGLTTGTSYYLRVRAIDSSNNNSSWTYWDGTGNAGTSAMSSATSFQPSQVEGGSGGSSEIAANTIVAGDIYANTITAAQIATDFALINNTIRSYSYSAGTSGWKINYDGTAEFNNNVTMRGATIIDSGLTVNSGNSVVFRVLTNGDVVSYGNLTVGDWATSGGAGINWDKTTNILSIRGAITATSGSFSGNISASTIDIGGSDTSSFHVDIDGNMWLGNATFSGATTSTTAFSVDNTGVIRANAGLIGAWSIQNNKLYAGTVNSSDEMLLDPSQQIISIGGGEVVVRRYTVGAGAGDVVLGVDGAGGYDPDYNTSGDIAMGRYSGITKFSVSDKLTFDGTDLSVSGDIIANTIATSSGKFSVDSSGNVTAANVISGGASNVRVRTSDSTYGGFSSTTAIEWLNSALNTTYGTLVGGILSISRTGMQLNAGSGSGNNYISVLTSSGDGVQLLATTSGSDNIKIHAGGDVTLEGDNIHLGTSTWPSVVQIPRNGVFIGNHNLTSGYSYKLYNNGGTLMWNGSAVGGSSVTYGTALTESGGVVNHDNYATTGTYGGTGRYLRSLTVNAQGHVTAIDTEYESTIDHNSLGSLTTGNPHTQYSLTGHTHTSFSSLTLTGDLTFSGYNSIKSAFSLYLNTNTNTNHITCYSGGDTRIKSSGLNKINAGTNVGFYANGQPVSNNTYRWGASNLAFNAVYSYSYPSVSDVNQKTDIQDATFGLDFVNGLRPVTFKWKETSDENTHELRPGMRDHHGFIAQEVEALLGEDAESVALWIDGHTPLMEASNEDDEDIPEAYNPGLRYDEFIPILTRAIQELSDKLDIAETRIAELESA